MKKLGLSDEEIAELVADDDAIEKGKKMDFDLTAEQQKEAKKYAKASRTPVVYNLDNEKGKRNRKENPLKASLIAEIANFLKENSANACENVEIINKEKLISFKIGENLYELDLKQKRKPKN